MRGRSELMERALAEAIKARGRTRPNPLVGCVIAQGARVVAVGHHARAGSPHAEFVALRRAGKRARGAVVYVTLEPCDHHGRTGPCTEALIAAGVRRVIVATRDPNPLVDGRGLRRLRKAGVQVEVGLLRHACRQMNEAYETTIYLGRPFVHVKLATSLDGRVATRTGESQWITGPAARKRGHVLRNEHDAVLVGRATVEADDPQLTCRVRGGRDPIRIILDTEARTPPGAKVVRIAKRSKAPTWIAVGPDAPPRRRAALDRAGAETFSCKLTRGRVDLHDLLTHLRERELLSVLVEGGPSVVGSFFDAGLVDKVSAFVAPVLLGGVDALSAVGGRGVAQISDAIRLSDVEVSSIDGDLLMTGYPKRMAAGRRRQMKSRS